MGVRQCRRRRRLPPHTAKLPAFGRGRSGTTRQPRRYPDRRHDLAKRRPARHRGPRRRAGPRQDLCGAGSNCQSCGHAPADPRRDGRDVLRRAADDRPSDTEANRPGPITDCCRRARDRVRRQGRGRGGLLRRWEVARLLRPAERRLHGPGPVPLDRRSADRGRGDERPSDLLLRVARHPGAREPRRRAGAARGQ